jgi:hypothetical protein
MKFSSALAAHPKSGITRRLEPREPIRLSSLPFDVWMLITENLEPEDAANIRLVSRVLCWHSAASEALLRLLLDDTINVWLHHDSLARLRNLAQSELRPYVRSLRFHLDRLDPPVSFDKYVEVLNGPGIYISKLKDTRPTRSAIKKSYRVYTESIELQNEALKTHLAQWDAAIKAFNNLDSLAVSSQNYFHSYGTSPYIAHCVPPAITNDVAVEEFKSIMTFLEEGKLTDLSAGCINWSMLRDVGYLLAPLYNLTTLRLVIGVSGDYLDSDDNIGSEVGTCAAALSNGRELARVIKRLSNLDHLSIQFEWRDKMQFGATSRDIFDLAGDWPRLRKLELSFVELDTAHMVAFFKKCARTLKRVCLANILFSNSLEEFFSNMREILSLEKFNAYGSFWEERGNVEWHLRFPGMKSSVRELLEAFFVNQGDYPLTHQRVVELRWKDYRSEEEEEEDPFEWAVQELYLV